MDLTSYETPLSSAGCGSDAPSSGHVPPYGGGVPAGSRLDSVEAFKLKSDGKWRRMSTDSFLSMTASGAFRMPIMMKLDGNYYCGNDEVWKALESKGDKRFWLHDFIIDNAKHCKQGWLHVQLKRLFAI